MNESVVTLSRSELYHRVWTTPVVKLSKEYGLSDVGFAKLCKRNNIPRPYLGYWARLEAGQKPSQTKLPHPEDDHVVTIRRQPQIHAGVAGQTPAGDTKAEPAPKMDVPVRDTLHGCHPLVSATKTLMDRAETDNDGLLRPPDDAPLKLQVSKNSLSRALRILDAVLQAVRRAGHEIKAGGVICLGKVEESISISEFTEVINREKPDVDLSGRYSFHFSRYETKRAPTGRLALHVGAIPRGVTYQSQTHWKDGKRKRLEELLPDFYEHLLYLEKRAWEKEKEEQEREKRRQEEARRQEIQRQKRAELRKKILAEQERVDELVGEMKNWRRSRDLRDYIKAKRQAHLDEHGIAEPKDDFLAWEAWAIAQADRMDPLIPSPPSILDKELPTREEVEKKYNTWGY